MRSFQKHQNLKNEVYSLVVLHLHNRYDHNRICLYDQIFNFFRKYFILKNLVYLKRGRDDTNFKPLYVSNSMVIVNGWIHKLKSDYGRLDVI